MAKIVKSLNTPVRNRRGMVIVGSLEKSIDKLPGGRIKRGGVVTCPRNIVSYIVANTLKLFPSSSLNGVIIGMTSVYVVSTSDGNYFLFMRSSSNATSKSGLDDAILDQN